MPRRKDRPPHTHYGLAALIISIAALALSCCTVLQRQPRTQVELLENKAAQSVWPLQMPDGHTFCTAFSIDEKLGYWMTARHCAHGPIDDYGVEGEWKATLGISWTNVVYRDQALDIAVLQSAHHAPALRFANRGAAIGESVMIIGFPYGLAGGKTATYGHVGALLVPIEGYYPSDILDIRVAPGNSGSPVLNEAGEVVGLLWGRFPDSGHSLIMPWDSVKRVGERYQHLAAVQPM